MKNILKKAICFACILLGCGQLSVQGQEKQMKHEVSVVGGLGLSTLKFKINEGDHSSKMGGVFGLGYLYHIDNNFGIRTGIEFEFYNAEGRLNSFTDSYSAKDAAGNFRFNTSVVDYKEKQRATYFNIPIMGQYEVPVFNNHQFYGAAGVTLGIPLSGKYKTSGADFKTSGSDFDYIDNPPTIENSQGLGFYSFRGRKIDEKLDFKFTVMMSLETGMKWELKSDLSLYTGIYFNYGLNDIRKDKEQKFLVYEPPYNNVKAENFEQNSMLNSQTTADGVSKSMTGNIRLMDLGLKIRLAYTLPY